MKLWLLCERYWLSAPMKPGVGASHGTVLSFPTLPVMNVSHRPLYCVQDNGYLHPESWEVLQVTAWIPLLPATKRNGCMQVLKGGHRAGKTCKHSCCVGGTWCAWSRPPSCRVGCQTTLTALLYFRCMREPLQGKGSMLTHECASGSSVIV